MNPRFLLFLLALGLVASPAFALSVNAPQQLSAYSNWSFQATFELLDLFNTATVSLDGQTVLAMSSDFRIAQDFQDHYLLQATASSRKLFVSLSGLEPGSHVLRVQTQDSSGNTLVSKEQPIQVIVPLDSSFQSDMQAQIENLKNQNTLLQQQLEQAVQQNQSLQQSLDSQKKLLDQQKDESQRLSSLVDLLQQKQSAAMKVNESTSQQVQSLETTVQGQGKALEGIQGGNPVSGMAVGSGTFSWSIATVLGMIILLSILGFTVYRHLKEKKLY